MATASNQTDTRGRGKLPFGTWRELLLSRERYSHTQEQAAEKLKVTPSTFSDWERCKKFPGLKHIKSLSSYMQMDKESLWLMILRNYFSFNI